MKANRIKLRSAALLKCLNGQHPRARFHRRASYHARGVALVEIAILAPLLILLMVGGIEFVRALRLQTSLAYASRQLTIATLRECLAPAASSTCVADQTQLAFQASSSMVGDLRIMMSIWDYDPALLVCQQRTWSDAGVTFSPPYQSFNLPNLDLSIPLVADLCRDEGVLVFGEASVEYEPLVPHIAGLFGLRRKVFRAVLLA